MTFIPRVVNTWRKDFRLQWMEPRCSLKADGFFFWIRNLFCCKQAQCPFRLNWCDLNNVCRSTNTPIRIRIRNTEVLKNWSVLTDFETFESRSVLNLLLNIEVLRRIYIFNFILWKLHGCHYSACWKKFWTGDISVEMKTKWVGNVKCVDRCINPVQLNAYDVL